MRLDIHCADRVGIAQEILNNAPLALKAVKSLFNSTDIEKLCKLQEKAYSTIIDTEDKKEALKAFIDKRKPNWKGK